MAQIRYQVFISSTFRDLQDERQVVLDAILNMNHFPAGMELFPASDSTPWEVIERVIDDSDYYVLIIGGKYGSTDSDGISYTEREYDYAKRTNKPVLAFLPKDPDDIPAGKVEMKPAAQKKLQAFREKLQQHHCKYWTDAKELQYQVAISLIQEINLNPAVGWVRANEKSDEDLMKRVIRLTEENERLREFQQSFAERRFPRSDVSQDRKEVRLFFAYSHADEGLRHQLETHLTVLVRQGVINVWSDRTIGPEDDWGGRSHEIETADIILILVSSDLVASKYSYDSEIKTAMERHDAGEAVVIPIILRPVDWRSTAFGKLQALPADGKPVTLWADHDAAMADIARGIRDAVSSIRR